MCIHVQSVIFIIIIITLKHAKYIPKRSNINNKISCSLSNMRVLFSTLDILIQHSIIELFDFRN